MYEQNQEPAALTSALQNVYCLVGGPHSCPTSILGLVSGLFTSLLWLSEGRAVTISTPPAGAVSVPLVTTLSASFNLPKADEAKELKNLITACLGTTMPLKVPSS